MAKGIVTISELCSAEPICNDMHYMGIAASNVNAVPPQIATPYHVENLLALVLIYDGGSHPGCGAAGQNHSSDHAALAYAVQYWA